MTNLHPQARSRSAPAPISPTPGLPCSGTRWPAAPWPPFKIGVGNRLASYLFVPGVSGTSTHSQPYGPLHFEPDSHSHSQRHGQPDFKPDGQPSANEQHSNLAPSLDHESSARPRDIRNGHRTWRNRVSTVRCGICRGGCWIQYPVSPGPPVVGNELFRTNCPEAETSSRVLQIS